MRGGGERRGREGEGRGREGEGRGGGGGERGEGQSVTVHPCPHRVRNTTMLVNIMKPGAVAPMPCAAT